MVCDARGNQAKGVIEVTVESQVDEGRPVTGELAPVLKVLVASSPMAVRIRERLAERSEVPAPEESGGEPAPDV